MKQDTNQLETIIEAAFEQRSEINLERAEPELREAILDSVNLLDRGQLRVAEKIDGQWHILASRLGE